MDIHQAAENSEHFEKPNNKYNHNHNIQDFFDVAIHRNE